MVLNFAGKFLPEEAGVPPPIASSLNATSVGERSEKFGVLSASLRSQFRKDSRSAEVALVRRRR